MSATPSTIIQPDVIMTAGALSRLFNAAFDGIARYFFRRAAMAQLHEYDDRALRDIGLECFQIEAAVYGLVALSRSEGVIGNCRTRELAISPDV